MRHQLGWIMALALVSACAQSTEENAPMEAATDSVAETPAAEVEIIATGANVSGSNGIHFGPDGLLYITSVVGSDITVIDPSSGDEIKRFTAADGVIGPDDVAFSSDGAFYWTSILTGEVAGFTPDGERIVAGQLGPGSNPITFSNDDRLFVSQCFLGTNLYELDPSGQTEPRLIADDLGPGCGLNGMDWGPDDRLYGPRWFVPEVVSYDVDTGERRVEATGFTTPAAIKFDSQGILHVLDTATGELIRVEDNVNEVVATFEPGLDNFAFDENDTPFVSSYTDGFIKRVNADGTITTLQPGGLAHPGGLAVIGDIVWVADGNALRGFDRQTGEEIVTQRNIVGTGQMGGSINLAAMGDALVLTSWFDGDARVWNPNTQERVAHYPNLAAPIAAVPYSGGIAVTEHFKGALSLYTEDGVSPLALDLPAPSGLAVYQDALYVSDRALGQVLVVARDGTALDEPEIVVSGLEAPEGFLVMDTGYVIVEAEAGQVVYVDFEGNRRLVATVAPGSPNNPGLPPSQIFNGIAMDEDGNLFLTGETARVLYRIKAPW